MYEFGSYQVPGQEDLADLRDLFPDKAYVGCDRRPGHGVDRIEDLHRLSLVSGSCPHVLCLDTLEHVERPWVAVRELVRVLAPDGLCVLSVPFAFPIHEHPADYYRFTPQGLMVLVTDALSSERCAPEGGQAFVTSQGPGLAPHTVAAVIRKSVSAARGRNEASQRVAARFLRLEADVLERWKGAAA